MHDAITRIPLSRLTLSPRNTRRTGGKDVDDLVAGIVAQGLLQNLIVEPLDDDLFGVIAGGRRLRALQRLEQEQRMPDALRDGIPCLVETDHARITEISAAENTIRQAMHPHDEFVAFRDLAAEGHGVDTIAARFGVSPLVVERRLRLANVSPVLLREFREDRATLEQLMALAITDDHAAQERIWEAARDRWDREPKRLREALMQRQVHSSDPRARFVGLDAYESAGGVVLRDLFDVSGGGYLADSVLLDRLVDEKLDVHAQQLRDEGWSFVKILRESPWQFTQGCTRCQPSLGAITAEVADELEALQERDRELDEAILAEEERTEFELDEDHPLIEEREAVQARIELIEASRKVYTAQQKAKGGAVVYMTEGCLRIERGLIPESQKAARDAASAAEPGTPAAQKPAPTLAETMLRRLSVHRTLAMQARLLQRADVALAALAHALCAPLFCDHGYDPTGGSLLKVTATAACDNVESFGFPDVSASDDDAYIRAAIADLRKTLGIPTKRPLLLPWMLEQSRETVVSLLAAVAVLTLDAVVRNPTATMPGAVLADALGLDMADHWQPTAQTFFGAVPRALTLEAVGEVCGPLEVARLELMKKDELAGAAEALLRRTGWLPKPLRRPGYALRTSKPDAPSDEAKPTLKARAVATIEKGKAVRKAKPAKKTAKATKKPTAKKPAPKKVAATKPRKRA